MSPTSAQRTAFDALLAVHHSVRLKALQPSAARLWRAACFDSDGRAVQSLYVYPDGRTSAQTRKIAA